MSLQSALMTALDATSARHPRKWWSAELGVDEATLSRWKHETRDMPVHFAGRVLEVLGEIAPMLAGDVAREMLRPARLTVEPMARPQPTVNSRRTGARLQKEVAEVVTARVDADEDGERDEAEIRKEVAEASDALEAAQDHKAVLEQELADRERLSAQARMFAVRAVAK